MSPSESGGSSLGDSQLPTQSLRVPSNRMLLEEDSTEELRRMHQDHNIQLDGVTSGEDEGHEQDMDDNDDLSDDNSFGPSSSYGERSGSNYTTDPHHHLTTTNTTTSATPTTSSSFKHNGPQLNTSGLNGSKSAISSPSLSGNANRRSYLGGPTDDASVLTLASSSKLRGRRKSIDTDASVRAIAPHSRKSLDLLDDDDGSGRSRGAAMGSGMNMNGFSRTGSMGGESSLKAGSITESIPPRSATTKAEQRISVPDIAAF